MTNTSTDLLKKPESATLWSIANDLTDATVMLDACNETFSFIFQELDQEGLAAAKSDDGAVSLADCYPMYSKMLFLIHENLHSCNTTMADLVGRLWQEVNSK